MYIEPLSYETLDEAINLVNKVFPYQSISENASSAFRLSLEQNSIIAKRGFSIIGITEARYWVAVDEQSRKVIGTTGLYCYEKDKNEAYWLGWTCVEPEARGQGIGGKLVDFAIEKARAEGKKFLRLYTSNHANQAIAQILYEKRGLRIIGESEISETQFKMLYRELEL
jgi:GNAT superfamily N-acetyltransferase